MAGSTEEWARYLRWNVAIAKVVYSPEQAGRPVYLDLEPDVLESVRDLAEPAAQDPTKALVSATKRTLAFVGGAAAVLRGHCRRLSEWERTSRLDPPPVIGLLATFSLAAENMREDEQFAANNFYDRLQELLGLTDVQAGWLKSAYRLERFCGGLVPASGRLWGSLNGWLESMEGNRGLPTAYVPPGAFRHVGLPLSQALVRETDRQRFVDLFTIYGLPPATVMHPAEMQPLLNEWQGRVPSPASNTLRKLWKTASARDRIAAVACQVLEAWPGTSRASSVAGRRIDRVKIKVQPRTFPRQRIDISLVLAASSDEPDEIVTVVDRHGAELGALECTSTASGWLTLADPSSIDAKSFLEGELELVRSDGERLNRRARLLVPLRRDELLLGYVECERATIGDQMALLVRDDLLDQLKVVLPTIARPGYDVVREMAGLPDGWAYVKDLQILASASRELLAGRRVDFNVLIPVAAEQVVIAGGMAIPGNIRKWSSARPPEVRVCAPGAGELAATISGAPSLMGATDIQVRERLAVGPVLVWDLADEQLPDGDYEVLVTNDRIPLGRTDAVRLRSAEAPALLLDRAHLCHALSADSFDVLTARAHVDGAFVVAPDAPPADSVQERIGAAIIPSWFAARRATPLERSQRARLALPSSSRGRCVVSGAHHMALEQVHGGMTSVEGVPLVRARQALPRATAAQARRARSPNAARGRTQPAFDPTMVAPVSASDRVEWALAFDAMCHVGAGPISALDRIAAQIDPSPLFADELCRRLEALGHIEVRRDPLTLGATDWEVTDPVLIGLADGSFSLTGFRSDRVLRELREVATSLGVSIQEDPIEGPARVRVIEPSATQVEALVEATSRAAGRPASAVPRAAEALAEHLPAFSDVLNSLKTTSAIGGRSFERWDPAVARFAPTADAGVPGAYRIVGHRRVYVYRRPDDIPRLTGLLCDARLVKYAAALDTGSSLVGYSPDAEVLYVPLGADLPGLYGRAAVLASGRPPHENEEERLLEYRRVSPRLAGALIDRLTT